MDRKALPDNHIRRVMDAGLPGLEDDLFFEERVLHRIRTMNKRQTRARKKISRGLAFALALVLMTVTAVTVTLTRGKEQPPVVVAALEGEGGELGFTDVPTTRPASGHTCVWRPQNTHQNVYRYDTIEKDVLCAQMIDVCGVCGRTNSLSYVPISEEPPVDHDWVVVDYHLEGTTAHVFYRVCTQCHTLWDRVELPCAGVRGIHIDPRYYDIWRELPNEWSSESTGGE